MENDLLKENRSLGFVSLEDCTKNIPPHIMARLLELRAAKASGKPAPAPSRGYIAEAEKRNLAAAAFRTVTRLFPAKTQRPAVAPTSELAVLRSIAHRQAAELREDQRVLARARRNAEEKRAADELAEQVAEMTAEVFPWERTN
jgi:hypothetical protein